MVMKGDEGYSTAGQSFWRSRKGLLALLPLAHDILEWEQHC
jgi:hypothetical protein